MGRNCSNQSNVCDSLVVRRRGAPFPVDDDNSCSALVVEQCIDQLSHPRPISRLQKSMCDEVNMTVCLYLNFPDSFRVIYIDKRWRVSVFVRERRIFNVDNGWTERPAT